MTIRTVSADQACAESMSRIDDAITIVHTGDRHLLLNMPRDIEELAAATQSRPARSWWGRIGDALGLGTR